MRLIHSIRRPANITFLSQSQRYQVNKTLSARLHPVLIEASNLVNGSNMLCHGRLYASASSDKMEAGKPRRRVSKKERKSMVEDYVKKYKETNAGKFPTVSNAVKYVGGSYYVVREILQELEYNCKGSSVDTKRTYMEKSTMKKVEVSTKTAEVSLTEELGDVVKPILEKDIENSGSEIVQSKKWQQSSVSVEAKLEDKQKLEGLEPKPGPEESTEISRRELQSMPTGDARKSSVWDNLKFFANEILSIWKRS